MGELLLISAPKTGSQWEKHMQICIKNFPVLRHAGTGLKMSYDLDIKCWDICCWLNDCLIDRYQFQLPY